MSQRIIPYGTNLFYSLSYLFNTTEATIEHSSWMPSKLAKANACICLCRWLGKAGSGRIDRTSWLGSNQIQPWLGSHQIQLGRDMQDHLQMKEKLSCCCCTPSWKLDSVSPSFAMSARILSESLSCILWDLWALQAIARCNGILVAEAYHMWMLQTHLYGVTCETSK